MANPSCVGVPIKTRGWREALHHQNISNRMFITTLLRQNRSSLTRPEICWLRRIHEGTRGGAVAASCRPRTVDSTVRS